MKFRSGIFVAALATWLCVATPARAELISTAIGLTALISSIGVSTAVAGAIGGAIIGVGVSVAINLAAQMFRPKTASGGADALQTPTGVQSSLTVGASVPRNAIVGPQATAGQLAYWNLYGDQNRFLQLVFTLGVGPHDDLTGIIVNGTRCTLGAYEGGGGAYTQYRPVTEFDKDSSHAMWVRFFNGFYDQVADQELIDFANPAGRWTTDHRGRGICYVSITLDYFNPEMWPQGIPQFLFELQGLRLYDRRKDSANGGTGLHRWDNQHTWEYSENVALALYLFERGLYIGDQKQLGRGLAPVDLISDLFAAAANICDEDVAIKEGGTEKRYRLGMNIGTDRDWSSVEHDFCTAMSGWLMESAGAYGPIAGAAQSSVVTFTDDDLLTGREIVYSQKRSRSELINTIFGTYTDPTQNWQAIPYPARSSSVDVALDSAELAAQRDYPMLFSLPQVQRAGEIERRLSRHQASAAVTLGFRYSNIEQGDWVTWVSARRDFTTKFLVTRINVDDDDSTSLSLREISDDVFDFDETVDELDPLNPGDLAGINVLVTSVPDFSIEALQIPGADGLTIPALHALWSPILDQTVDEVYVEYRIVGTTDTKVSPTFTPANGEGIISDGIQANTPYEARANILTTPIRETFWTAWTPVTAPVQHIVPTSRHVVAGGVDMAALRRDVQELFSSAERNLRNINQFIAAHAAEQEVQNLFDRVRAREDIGGVRETVEAHVVDVAGLISTAKAETIALAEADINGAIASYNITVQTQYSTPVTGEIAVAKASAIAAAASNTTSAIAAYNVTVTATYATLSGLSSASASTLSSAQAYADSAVGSLSTAVTASFATTNANVTTNASAIATLNGYAAASYSVTLDVNGYATGFQLVNGGPGTSVAAFSVDYFYIAKPGVTGGSPVPIFTVGTINGVAKVGIRGDLLVDGDILSRHLSVGVIDVGTLIADNIIITDHIVTEAVTQIYPSQSDGDLTTSSAAWFDQELVSFSVTAPNGTPITIEVTLSQTITNGTIACSTRLFVVALGSLVQHDFAATASNSTFPDSLSSSFSYTATGSAHSFTISSQFQAGTALGGGAPTHTNNRRLLVKVFKK